jgi:hypothetical protein
MRRPDYGRIAELEREVFGEALTPRPPVAPWRGDGVELDAAVRDAFRLLLSWGRVPPELAGSRLVPVARLAVQGLLTFALVYLCLGIAGVVPWQ